MADNKQLLVDTLSFRATALEESASSPGKYIARGEFARADRATENKRLYPANLWEREIGRLSKQLKEMKIYGELDHPMDGRTQLKRVSHIVTDLRLEGDVVIGSALILDTDEGRNLKAILDGGGAVGVSSRGFGTTKPNFKGEEVVQPDYRLMTFDFVAEPAQQSAYPEVSVESVDNSKGKPSVTESPVITKKSVTFEEFKRVNPALAEHFADDAEREYEKRAAEIWAKKITAAKQEAASALRAEFAEKLDTALTQAKKEMEKSISERLMNDPEVAGAKKTLGELKTLLRPWIIPEDVEEVFQEKEEQIESLSHQLVEKDREIKNLRLECDKLAVIAKEAGYRFHLEQRLHDLGFAKEIRSAVGDVKQYKSLREMNDAVNMIAESIIERETAIDERNRRAAKLEEDLARKQAQLEADIARQYAEAEAERSRYEAEVARHKAMLESEAENQRAIAEKALEASRKLAAQVYLEQRLSNHPNKDYARALVESHQPETREDVDSLLSKTLSRATVNEDLESARARVRSLLNSGTREYIQENEENPASKGGSNVGVAHDYNGLGANLNEIRALSGLPGKGTQSN